MKPDNVAPIRVGGFYIKVKDRTNQLQYQQVVANFEGGTNTIGISTNYSVDVQAQALLHEIGHAIEAVYLEGDALTERQLSAFTQGMYQVIRDNPHVIRLICRS